MSIQNTHTISLEEAIALTTRFRAHRPNALPISETFSKSAVICLLEQKGADRLRIYLGEKEDGRICTVLVAANEWDQDILALSTDTASIEQALILQDAIRCPELCPPPSALNG